MKLARAVDDFGTSAAGDVFVAFHFLASAALSFWRV
jgi:hypothetical protein